MPKLIEQFLYARIAPTSHQRFTAEAHHGVEAARGAEGCQPAGERSQGVEQQQHRDARAFAGEAVFKTLAVTVGFEVTERQFDLHASGVQGHELVSGQFGEFGRSGQQPRLAFAGGVLAGHFCNTSPARMLRLLFALRRDEQTATCVRCSCNQRANA